MIYLSLRTTNTNITQFSVVHLEAVTAHKLNMRHIAFPLRIAIQNGIASSHALKSLNVGSHAIRFSWQPLIFYVWGIRIKHAVCFHCKMIQCIN